LDIRKAFNSIGKNMLTDFELFQSQIKHAGERGAEREEVLKKFLSLYLPTKYAVSDGEIVDMSGGVSDQSDIVIYDHINTPLLLSGKNYRAFPSESVFATIEVKSVLTSQKLKEAANNISTTKSLLRDTGPIAGVVFAYTSAWKKDPIKTATLHLQEINSSLEPHQYIDLLCILDTGIITLLDKNGEMRIPKDFSGRYMMMYHNLIPPVLLWFFLNLMDLLNSQKKSTPNYHDYVGGGEIGDISMAKPA